MKKVEFYKLCKNNNGYFLAKGEGIKKTFEYEGEEIVIYFEKNKNFYECTEETTGLFILTGEKIFNKACTRIQEILSSILIVIKTERAKECADILSKLKSELEGEDEIWNAPYN